MKKACIVILVFLFAVQVSGFWREQQLGTTEHLRGIHVLAPDSIWIAGTSGLIMHFNGTGWDHYTTPIDTGLNAIKMIDDTEGWAVGDESVILHYSEGTWSEIEVEIDQISLEDLVIISPENVIMVGHGFLSGGRVFQWDGNELSTVFEFTGNVQALAASGSDSIWGVGSQSTRIHFNGSEWSEDSSPLPDPANLFDVTVDENGNPVACGNRLPEWEKGNIYTYSEGSGWTMLYSDYSPWLLSIDIQENVGFVLGKDGRAIESSIYGWRRTTDVTRTQVNEIDMFDSSRGWAVCDQGKILVYEDPDLDLTLTDKELATGDDFHLQLRLLNPQDTLQVSLFVFLEAYGYFYFWPSWSESTNFETRTLTADSFTTESILQFEWPEVGSPGSCKFWGALLFGGTDIVGYDTETLEWY